MFTIRHVLPLARPALAPAGMARSGGSGPVAEIVTFRLAPGVAEAAFLEAAQALSPLLRDAPGFVARRLSRGDDASWTDHVEWRSLAEARTAAANLMARDDAAPFLAAIDPGSIVMRHEALRLALPD